VSAVRRHQTRKTETDAKVSKTQHPSRRSDNSERRTAEEDAKVSSTQHSPRNLDSPKSLRQRTSSSQNRGRSMHKENRKCRGRMWPNRAKFESVSSSESNSSKDEDDILLEPKHMMKLQKFEGQSLFETFMAQFSNCAEYSEWNPA